MSAILYVSEWIPDMLHILKIWDVTFWTSNLLTTYVILNFINFRVTQARGANSGESIILKVLAAELSRVISYVNAKLLMCKFEFVGLNAQAHCIQNRSKYKTLRQGCPNGSTQDASRFRFQRLRFNAFLPLKIDANLVEKLYKCL
jgi:hypothetical protein